MSDLQILLHNFLLNIPHIGHKVAQTITFQDPKQQNDKVKR
jgi:recombinational DNA repair protein RecR